MRRAVVLLAALGCAEVSPDAPDAGCEARPPADWEVLVDGDARGPVFHGSRMFFSRGSKQVDERLRVWSFFETDLDTHTTRHVKTVDVGDATAALVAADDRFVWIGLGTTPAAPRPGGVLRVARDAPGDAPDRLCDGYAATAVGHETVFCLPDTADRLDRVGAWFVSPSTLAAFATPAPGSTVQVLGDEVLVARPDGLVSVPAGGGMPRVVMPPEEGQVEGKLVRTARASWFVDGGRHLVRLDADGTTERVATLPFSDEYDHVFTVASDGTRLYLGPDFRGATFFRYDTVTRRLETVAGPSPLANRVAVHDEHLYAWGDGAIYRTPLASLSAAWCTK